MRRASWSVQGLVGLSALLLVGITPAPGQEEAEIDPAVQAFSEAIGLSTLIEGVVEQTRASLLNAMLDYSGRLRTRYPDMNTEQSEQLDEIVREYIDTIMDSIDPAEASRIYSSVIAGGMQPEVLESATSYYSSPEGQATLQVVGQAAEAMNTYVLRQVTDSTSVAYDELVKDVREFTAAMPEPEAEGAE